MVCLRRNGSLRLGPFLSREQCLAEIAQATREPAPRSYWPGVRLGASPRLRIAEWRCHKLAIAVEPPLSFRTSSLIAHCFDRSQAHIARHDMQPNSSDWNEQEWDKQNNEQESHRTNPKGFKTERQVRLVYMQSAHVVRSTAI
jgi:hypothetical protein